MFSLLERRRRKRADWYGASAAPEAGFAAVDALVALTILTVTLILAIDAGAGAKKAAVSADETRRAGVLLRYLVDTSPRSVGALQGHAGSFDWTLNIERAADAPVGNVGACSRLAAVRSRTSGRTFSLATTDLCPLGSGA